MASTAMPEGIRTSRFACSTTNFASNSQLLSPGFCVIMYITMSIKE